MNPHGAVDAALAVPPPAGIGSRESGQQPTPHIGAAQASDTTSDRDTCDWVYFATTAKWSGVINPDWVKKHGVIIRSVHNTAGQLIANVQHLKPGERILLVHGEKGKYREVFSGTMSAPRNPVEWRQHSFDVFSYIDESQNQDLSEGGFSPDPMIKKFTGISITEVKDLRERGREVRRPAPMGTIWRWDKVFGK
jgi:hypothetical protein